MVEPRKYIVRYTIEGEREIMAESREQAQKMFIDVSVEDLAICGDLIADDPRTPEEIRQEAMAVCAKPSILSAMPDGVGYYYGFKPDGRRVDVCIDVSRGPSDLLWRAYVSGVRVGDSETGVFATKAAAEAAALAWIADHPRAKLSVS